MVINNIDTTNQILIFNIKGLMCWIIFSLTLNKLIVNINWAITSKTINKIIINLLKLRNILDSKLIPKKIACKTKNNAENDPK